MVPLVGSITHVTTPAAAMSLTFDDGPHPHYTDSLLEILAARKAKATFFFVGKLASEHPSIVARASQAGHAIGVHSWDHSSMPLLTRRQRLRQIKDTRNALGNNAGNLFRSPFGFEDLASAVDVKLAGYQSISWNVDIRDWQKRTTHDLVNDLKEKMSPGNILLLHDNLYKHSAEDMLDRRPVLDALDLFLRQAPSHFCFPTVPELLKLGTAHRRLITRRGEDAFFAQLVQSDPSSMKFYNPPSDVHRRNRTSFTKTSRIKASS